MHNADEFTPTSAEKVPAGQRKQDVPDDAPVVVEYKPAAQLTHEVALLLDTQVPALQRVHADEFDEAAYRPGVQAMHVDEELAPVVDEAVPGGQATHVAEELEPSAAEYEPAPQGAHRDAFTALENVPAGHAVQLAAPGSE